jgi:Asp-tRNA(Asn)/Glu-tRNA(Gln) amidotransferase A subunit family amidase
VAAGLCYATVDTDAIGSCRLPAACCGAAGLKVSPGLISQEGILAREKTDTLIEYLAQTGITTRSAHDSRIIEADRKKIGNILFKDVDLLILPTTVDKTLKIELASKLGDQAVDPNNTMFCNYFGLPAVSVPCGRDSNGMPLGLEIVSYAGGEEWVLDLADAYEKATPWHLRRPDFQYD